EIVIEFTEIVIEFTEIVIEFTEIVIEFTEIVIEFTEIHKGRPRRFGKSLFLSTPKAHFEGKKQLFEGLKIAELNSVRDSPVIFFYTRLKFRRSIKPKS
ncbi:MAG: AAA family ATPase, partial [Marinilabiliaceae bacterium]|nr:AAA family ATPase [Marinilabiliaceae bacterium]